jgi:hypothetical protein
MATYSKHKLSESTLGKQIKVAATATPGTLIHTAVAAHGDTDKQDEVWIYASNQHTSFVALTIEFGGISDPDDLITVTVPSKSGLILVIPGLILYGSIHVRAFAGTTNKILLSGYVNRIAT